jgi:hypothetical protein
MIPTSSTIRHHKRSGSAQGNHHSSSQRGVRAGQDARAIQTPRRGVLLPLQRHGGTYKTPTHHRGAALSFSSSSGSSSRGGTYHNYEQESSAENELIRLKKEVKRKESEEKDRYNSIQVQRVAKTHLFAKCKFITSQDVLDSFKSRNSVGHFVMSKVGVSDEEDIRREFWDRHKPKAMSTLTTQRNHVIHKMKCNFWGKWLWHMDNH